MEVFSFIEFLYSFFFLCRVIRIQITGVLENIEESSK